MVIFWERFFLFICIISADINSAKPVTDWGVHHGSQVIVLVNNASAGGVLRFAAEAQLLADAVCTHRRTVLNKLTRVFLKCQSIQKVFDQAFV